MSWSARTSGERAPPSRDSGSPPSRPGGAASRWDSLARIGPGTRPPPGDRRRARRSSASPPMSFDCLAGKSDGSPARWLIRKDVVVNGRIIGPVYPAKGERGLCALDQTVRHPVRRTLRRQPPYSSPWRADSSHGAMFRRPAGPSGAMSGPGDRQRYAVARSSRAGVVGCPPLLVCHADRCGPGLL